MVNDPDCQVVIFGDKRMEVAIKEVSIIARIPGGSLLAGKGTASRVLG